ncbi:MAG: methionyl-tRNA formyltransferase [Muribaculaceae bacterium]|nr:methionyl-tRNA formyltransferase [Muribaculaceae bacterium]
MNKSDLKIVFFGTPEFAVESLDALVQQGYNISAVVTMPDKAAGRGQKISHSAVKKYALEHNLTLLQPENLKSDDFINSLKKIAADLFIVIAFRMLPQAVWAMPPLGTFNLHASLLPKYRGAAPINRAVMNGETETGVTTFFLKHEIDTGDVISRQKIDIGPDEDAGSVHDRLMSIGANLTVDTVERIIAGNLSPIPQCQLATEEIPTPAPKIFKEDCKIDWSWSANAIHNHVRGLAPYPAAWSNLSATGRDGDITTTVKILRTAHCDISGLMPGQLAFVGKKAAVGTADKKALILESVQPAGKKPMPGADFLRGLRPGENGNNPYFV